MSARPLENCYWKKEHDSVNTSLRVDCMKQKDSALLVKLHRLPKALPLPRYPEAEALGLCKPLETQLAF